VFIARVNSNGKTHAYLSEGRRAGPSKGVVRTRLAKLGSYAPPTTPAESLAVESAIHAKLVAFARGVGQGLDETRWNALGVLTAAAEARVSELAPPVAGKASRRMVELATRATAPEFDRLTPLAVTKLTGLGPNDVEKARRVKGSEVLWRAFAAPGSTLSLESAAMDPRSRGR